MTINASLETLGIAWSGSTKALALKKNILCLRIISWFPFFYFVSINILSGNRRAWAEADEEGIEEEEGGYSNGNGIVQKEGEERSKINFFCIDELPESLRAFQGRLEW